MTLKKQNEKNESLKVIHAKCLSFGLPRLNGRILLQ